MSEGSAEQVQPIQRFILDNGLLGSSDLNQDQAVWRMCHLRISSFTILSKELLPQPPKSKSGDSEPETVRIAVSMRKSNRRTLRTPPFELNPNGAMINPTTSFQLTRALDIQFSFRYAHTFRELSDVLIVRLQRATKKKRHSTIALVPIYLSDVLQCPLDDDITLSQRKEKAWVPYCKIHVLIGSYPEHVTSLDDAQDWEFGLLPEGQHVNSDDENLDQMLSDNDELAISPSPVIANYSSPVRRTQPLSIPQVNNTSTQQQQQTQNVSGSAPDVGFSDLHQSQASKQQSQTKVAPKEKQQEKKKKTLKTRPTTPPKSQQTKKGALALASDDLNSSSSSSDDDELPPAYSSELQQQQQQTEQSIPLPSNLSTNANTTTTTTTASVNSSNAIFPSINSDINQTNVNPSVSPMQMNANQLNPNIIIAPSTNQPINSTISSPSTQFPTIQTTSTSIPTQPIVSIPTTTTASATITTTTTTITTSPISITPNPQQQPQNENSNAGLPFNFTDPEMQRSTDAYERIIRDSTRILLCDGQKRRSRKIIEIGERPRIRESKTVTVCTRSSRDVAALLNFLFDRRGDESTSIVIAGSDRYVNDVIRPFLELSNTKPLNSEPVKFFVIPVGKSSDVALHVASLDTEYRSLFCDEAWSHSFDKREPLSPEEITILEQRVLRYLDSASAVCRFDVGEAMLTLSGSGPARSMPFLKAVQVVPTDSDYPDASIDYWTVAVKKKTDHDQHHQVKSPLQTLVLTRLPGIAAKVLHLERELFPTADTLSTVILLNKTGLKSVVKAFAGKISVMMHDKAKPTQKDKDKEKDKEKSSPQAQLSSSLIADEHAAAAERNSIDVVDLSPKLQHNKSSDSLKAKDKEKEREKEKAEKEREKSDKEKEKSDKDKEKVEQITTMVSKLMCSADSQTAFRVIVDGVDFNSVKLVSIKPTWRSSRPFFIHCFTLSRQQSSSISTNTQ